jgi:hypothetical protein
MSIKIKRIHTLITSHPLRADRVVVSAAGSHDKSELTPLGASRGRPVESNFLSFWGSDGAALS